MASQPIVTIEQWFTEGWRLYKRHPVTFFFASLLGALICIPPVLLFFAIPLSGGLHPVFLGLPFSVGWQPFFFAGLLGTLIFIPPALLFFAAPFYAGLYCMALKAMRGEKPRIRDIFKGFRRFWAALFLWWLSLIAIIVLGTTAIGILAVPLLWAMSMLALPLLIDERKGVGSAFGAAFKAVFTWKNCARFWLYGLAVPLVSVLGVLGFGFGLFITVPLAVCVQVVAYRDLFKPEEAFQQEVLEPWQDYPFKLKAKYIGPVSRIRDIRNQIFEQIHSTDDSVKSLLEGSIEHIDNVFAKAAHLSHRLQQIDDYLETTSMQTLHIEKTEITRKLAESPNAAVYAQYEEALRTLEERIENHGRLEELREQISARLMTIRVSLDNTHAKIIRIRTTEVSNAQLESDDVSRALKNLQIEMDALLKSLDEMSETA